MLNLLLFLIGKHISLYCLDFVPLLASIPLNSAFVLQNKILEGRGVDAWGIGSILNLLHENWKVNEFFSHQS